MDLRFAEVRKLPQLSSRSSQTQNASLILARLTESFSWLFYGEQLRDFELLDISSTVPEATGAALQINAA